ncbi:MAG: RHS repeat-associated core domain-containing protein [Candidatus Marinimicrobia bacterium]|nr:RHS repeat-associated core domain-containing protein [Candidatus Neomarinimicrobiota bacterium]
MGCLKLEREEKYRPSLRVIHRALEVSKKECDNYYPFGLELDGEWSVGNDTDYNYLYNGKEVQRELGLGWINYGARFMDPTIGRFVSVDPLADRYAYFSTYSYVLNNPIGLIDPDGMRV